MFCLYCSFKHTFQTSLIEEKKKTNKKQNNDLIAFSKCCKILQILPVVQLSPFNPASHVHHPSVCRHLSLLQLGEQFCEQFVPKYPSLQARKKIHKVVIGVIKVQTHKTT